MTFHILAKFYKVWYCANFLIKYENFKYEKSSLIELKERLMPELPEVQGFVNAIKKSYVGLTLKNIKFHREDLRYPFQVKELKEIFAPGNKLLQCYREGKQLVLETNHGSVSISLGMSGAFKPILSSDIEKHQHVSVFFENGEGFAYVDPRRFGFWKIKDTSSAAQKVCDPLQESELLKLFLSPLIREKNTSIKDILMDQKLIGGIGNIYAVEALYIAKIHPLKNCTDISVKQWKSLAQAIPEILQLAIEMGGSSISSYRTLNGDKGSFQHVHRVYGRTGLKCLQKNCSGTIERIVQKGRSSWFCSECQSKSI